MPNVRIIKIAGALSLLSVMSMPWRVSHAAEATDENPTYVQVVSSTHQTATMHICQNGVKRELDSVKTTTRRDIFQVPTGQLITLTSTMRFGNIYCFPDVTFVPQPGQRYLFDEVPVPGGCLADLVRVDPEAELGISVEPSIQQEHPGCVE